MKVCMLHPDLGIGGAERLVCDMALALKESEHEVAIYTSHHSPQHSFAETNDGRIDVRVFGDFLPRSLFGRCMALCAYVRMLFLAVYVMCVQSADVFIVDQVSIAVPLLRMSGTPVIFYCHFPDQLLTARETTMKRLYRAPLDWVEQWSTGMANTVLVNSHFTEGVFRSTFPSLHDKRVQVLYPSLHTDAFDKVGEIDSPEDQDITFVSINRYEGKKNLPLALHAFVEFVTSSWYGISKSEMGRCRLVMAGGYDPRVVENAQVFTALEEAIPSTLKERVTLLRSPNDVTKIALLKNAWAVLYTPHNEHFGIVPLEAMYAGTPVIATNSGGPLETVVDGETGYLCEAESTDYAMAMSKIVNNGRHAMREKCQQRVRNKFSFDAFKRQLNDHVSEFN